MKFLAVFVTLAAVAFGLPSSSTWTLNELSNALQSPETNPALIPYLEHALNQMMAALHHGQQMETITIAMPIIVEYNLQELSAALQDPNTNPAHIPYLEAALDQIMDAFFAGVEKPTVTVVLPPVATENKPDFVDVWPVQVPEEEPSFIDVWPVQIPEADSVVPVAPAPVESSPLVQIIVNVQKTSDVSTAAEETVDHDFDHVIERPSPLPGWGNFI